MGNSFKEHLDAYLAETADFSHRGPFNYEGASPFGGRHISDTIYKYIKSIDDFEYFLEFLSKADGGQVDYSAFETATFLEGTTAALKDPDTRARAKKFGIESDLGLIAYAMVLGIGEP